MAKSLPLFARQLPGGLMYLCRLPDPGEALPKGYVLVHNHRTPSRDLDNRYGFHLWAEKLNIRIEPCDCGFAPELQSHYRIKRLGIAGHD
jgi:hypothetical protein